MSRSLNYSTEEDAAICEIYLDISQNPIIGINQSRDRFWSRVENAYNDRFLDQQRSKRSLESRWAIILKHVTKMRGCIRQVENRKRSGASEQDIVSTSVSIFCC